MGATPSFQITVRVDSDVVDGSQLTNDATVVAASDIDPSNDTATETTDVIAVADLQVAKSSTPNPFVPGAPLTYTISVLNAGPSDALVSDVTDTLPAGFTATSISSDLGAGDQCTQIGEDVSCTLGTLAPLEQVVITIVGLSDASATQLVNTASATTDTTDSDPTNDSATDTNDGSPLADLVVTKTDSVDPVVAGAPLTYTITLVNNGPSDAQNVSVADAPPTGFTVATVDRAECDTTVSCTFPTIAAGESEVIVITGDVASSFTDTGDAAAPELSNTASVTSTTPDPVPADNSDTETTDVIESANVMLTKIEQGSDVTPGGQRTYTIQIANAGPSDADDVVVTDDLPTGLTFATASGATCAPTSDPAIVTCDLGTLAAGSAPVVVTMVVDVDPGVTGPVANSADAVSSTPDPVPGDNGDMSQDPTAPDADLSIAKTDSVDPVAGRHEPDLRPVRTELGSVRCGRRGRHRPAPGRHDVRRLHLHGRQRHVCRRPLSGRHLRPRHARPRPDVRDRGGGRCRRNRRRRVDTHQHGHHRQ